MPKHNTGIYKITNTANGKCYVGSAVDLSLRFKAHKNRLNQGVANRRLQNSWKKHGIDVFEFKILLFCNKHDLLFYEQRAIDVFKSAGPKGYNISPTAGNNLGLKHTAEQIAKYSKSRMGHPTSDETKQKLSIALKGRIFSEETRKKLSISVTKALADPKIRKRISDANKGRPSVMKGKKHTEQSRRNMSEAHKGNVGPNKGKKFSEETRRKLSESHRGPKPWLKGRRLSEERIKQMSEFNKGKTHSEEHKQKISDSITKWWENRKAQNG